MFSLLPATKCFPYFRNQSAFLTSGIEVRSLLPASKYFPYFWHRNAFLSSGIEVLSYLPASKCFPYFRHRSALLTSRIEVLSLLPTSKFFYSILVDDICSWLAVLKVRSPMLQYFKGIVFLALKLHQNWDYHVWHLLEPYGLLSQ